MTKGGKKERDDKEYKRHNEKNTQKNEKEKEERSGKRAFKKDNGQPNVLMK